MLTSPGITGVYCHQFDIFLIQSSIAICWDVSPSQYTMNTVCTDLQIQFLLICFLRDETRTIYCISTNAMILSHLLTFVSLIPPAYSHLVRRGLLLLYCKPSKYWKVKRLLILVTFLLELSTPGPKVIQWSCLRKGPDFKSISSVRESIHAQ